MITTKGGYSIGDQLLGRYELVRYISHGGMGIVWEASDLTLDRVVALKHVRFRDDDEAADEDRRRTLREARTAAKLSDHPHIITIYDVQEVAGDIWLVLEYLPSESLAQRTSEGRLLEVTEAARIGAEVALALDAAHERGIVHRDVKPGNVLLGSADGEVKLTDFGIAHAEGEHPVTQANVISGTPAYMAPEVARGHAATPASDVFSLGATLYRLVEGRTPFDEGENTLQTLMRVAHESPTPPRQAGPFSGLLMHFLELDPRTRPTAADAHRLLDDFVRRLSEPTKPPKDEVPPPPEKKSRFGRRALLAAASLLVVAALVVGVVVFLPSGSASGIPALPESVGAVRLTGDVRAADPCALLDTEAVAGLGRARIGPGGSIYECRLTIDLPDGQRIYNDVHFGNTVAEGARGPVQQLGEVTLAREGHNPRGCSSDVVLADNNLIAVNTRYANSRAGSDPCPTNEAVLAVVVDRLNENGISYRPGWMDDISLARQQACDVPGDSPAQIPGMLATQRSSYLNGSACFIGLRQKGVPYVAVTLGVEPNGGISNYGTPSTIGGKAAFTRSIAGYYNPTACRVSLEHRPSYSGGANRPTEYISVQVEGSAPYDELCRQADAIASASEKFVSS
ncbi:serine/threonine-protein kinase [Actinomycetospora termitidis]|uniref:non-specific serine/threonine protein kinase n=1 Tax=Actinomycetospora termitidis TaxID=3053470 RepID=A0ABT7MGE4_9PSEU|nr:serine/threonine-protein kinase [Actinomycetospora sp. Odt1-22]MDL5159012.1 serine/threonine-protein kinase [Actinomycetospora sp. Odt1-22]